jgi:hypothetical protein
LKNSNFEGITVHFINDLFVLNSLTLCLTEFSGPHDAENLCAYLKFCFEKYQIGDKIVSVCADNAADIQLGLQFLKEDGKTAFTGRCMGHMIQLIVKKVIDVVKGVAKRAGIFISINNKKNKPKSFEKNSYFSIKVIDKNSKKILSTAFVTNFLNHKK